MAGYGEQKYGSDDTYNKSVRGQTDEYGNPTQKHSTGEHGATGTDGQHTTGLLSKLNPTGSNSSSSSEDDGVGGRRKKGVVEKIKEKLPGQKQEEQKYNSSTGIGTGGAYGTGTKTGGEHGSTGIGGYGNEETREQKGMMDKNKEKLPGQKN